MSTSLNLHCVTKMEAQELGTSSSLKIMDKEGNWVTVFMRYEIALATAAAFEAAKTLSDEIARLQAEEVNAEDVLTYQEAV